MLRRVGFQLSLARADFAAALGRTVLVWAAVLLASWFTVLGASLVLEYRQGVGQLIASNSEGETVSLFRLRNGYSLPHRGGELEVVRALAPLLEDNSGRTLLSLKVRLGGNAETPFTWYSVLPPGYLGYLRESAKACLRVVH